MQCPLGHMCPDSLSDPNKCNEGTYSLLGQTNCTECPLGFSCLSTDARPTTCPKGWYSAEGEAVCTPCPPGYYCPINPPTGLPIRCSNGYFTSSNESTQCEKCPAGNECSDPAKEPQPCPAGYFSANNGSVLCTMVNIVL